MNQSMINSAVTMGQIQHKLDTIGNNLANVNTTGYKRRDTTFSDLLVQHINNQIVHSHEVGRQTPNGIRVGSGAAVAQTAIRFEQGSIQTTGRPLDIALTEKGYFFELTPAEDGTRRFTRDGAFYLTPNPAAQGENLLVNQNGDYILSVDGNPISIPAGHEELNITEEGVIEVVFANGQRAVAGQIQLVQITKPQLLLSAGENTFVFPNLADLELNIDDVLNEAAGTQVFMQGALESSNVDMGREITEMMLAQRSYQFNAQAISITDQMMGLVNNIR
ncbi:flagellar basal-body rod protein FlgG [Evansella caseinilytica]|uniref:Flagellar basal-body rod protein FlgG n=1 Tax=Evansella caseinilytica TaxID=1503961 RepID=A0A1H3T886_9BACI|nr:flagellar hook-basal body protein [Evansella caseinilytica]SDZ46270.1 flagellar basal-body rod protein FlgG [Evansella caseinilytica]